MTAGKTDPKIIAKILWADRRKNWSVMREVAELQGLRTTVDALHATAEGQREELLQVGVVPGGRGGWR